MASMALDFTKLRETMRTVLLGAEEVVYVATGETVGIRDGVYDANPSYYTRPDSPAIRPIIAAADCAWDGRTFDNTNKTLFLSEILLPATDRFTNAVTEEWTGIMQYTIFVLKGKGSETLDLKTRLICDVFARDLPRVTVDQAANAGLIFDRIERTTPLIDDKWMYVPVSITTRTYGDSTMVPSSLWTPAEISTEGWWDASDEGTITVTSGEVTQLDDKSGNDQHLTQSVGFGPATGTYTLNGLNMMYYDGTEALATYGDNFAVPASGNFSVFQVGEVSLPLENVADGMFGMLCSGLCRDWQFVGGVNVLDWNGRLVVDELGGTNTNFSPAMGIGASLYNVVFDYDSSTITGYVTGDSRTGTAYTLKASDPQTFIIMSNRVGNALAGHVGETLIIEDVSEATRQLVEGYSAWKWGIEDALPVSHPYKTGAPRV